MSSVAPKKKAFDWGGPVWPPRSNAEDSRSVGGSGGALSPKPKTGGFGGQRPQPKSKNESFLKKIRFWLGGAALQTPQFWAGGQSPPRPPPKRSSAAFDRGGQTGPPRSNAFFSAPLTTQAPPTTVRPDARRHARPDVAPDPNQKPVSQILIMGVAVTGSHVVPHLLHLVESVVFLQISGIPHGSVPFV